MDFYRIGDKLLSKEKLFRVVDKILSLRSSGLSQQDVAQRVGCDRTFISRLETLAEVRKGGTLAIIGFPLSNVDELKDVCRSMGVDYTFLMNDEERWAFIQSLSGKDLLNWLMKLISELSDYDNVIMIGSDMRIRLAEAILGDMVIGWQIGESPITEDVHISSDELMELIGTIKGVLK